MYIAPANVTYTGIGQTQTLVVNKDLLTVNSMEMPYDKVKDGTWTFDEFLKMSTSVYKDDNGNGKADHEDIYGYTYYITQEGWGLAFELPALEEVDGELGLHLDMEKTQAAVEKIFALNRETGSYDRTDWSTVSGETVRKFTRGQVLFDTFYFSGLHELRDSEVNFGLLPYPKWDEAQENYHALRYGQAVVIPGTSTDHELSGIMIEAMCSSAYESIIPAFYETTLGRKILQDPADVEMLDLIYASSTPWNSLTFGNYTVVVAIIDKLTQENNEDFASWYASKENEITAGMASLNEIYGE